MNNSSAIFVFSLSLNNLNLQCSRSSIQQQQLMFASRPKTWFTACVPGFQFQSVCFFLVLCFDSQDGITVPGLHVSRRDKTAITHAQGPEGRIREMFKKADLSVCSYDTAWIAMVPSLDSPQQPCFPESLNWLLENQLNDGSWSLPCRHQLLIKDSMLSTLACVLALKPWEIGDEHVKKGLDFMGSNTGSIIDKEQLSPIGLYGRRF